MKNNKTSFGAILCGAKFFVYLLFFTSSYSAYANAAVITQQSWVPYNSVFSDWMAVGDVKQVGDWEPAIDGQSKPFTQTLKFSRLYKRLEQKREKNTATNSVRKKGNPVPVDEIKYQSKTRKVDLTTSSWTDSVKVSSSPWIPVSASQTKEYLQGRTFSQVQERTIEYYVDGALVDTHFDSRSRDNNDEMRSVHVVPAEWTPLGSPYNCTPWNPDVANYASDVKFSQTRRCSQKEERVFNHTANGEIIHTHKESRLNIDWLDSRWIEGGKYPD